MSHFKHNPDKRGTLASELGSSPLTEHDQRASLWANTNSPPKPARGSKRAFDGCPPGFSCIDDYDDDDEELVFFKQERSSESMETAQARLASTSPAYHLRTHNTNRHPGLDAGRLLESHGTPRKLLASDDHHITSCGQKAAFKVCSLSSWHCSAQVSLTNKSRRARRLIVRT
jgi:hypothetical protein